MAEIPVPLLIRRIAEVVGEAKARAAVDSALVTLQLSKPGLSQAEAISLLQRLTASGDVLALAAKLLLVKVELGFERLVSEATP